MAEKPLVDPHLGPAPDDLLIEEIIVGDGDEAIAGQTAVVHYVGVGVTSGEEFDASWNRNEPFSFRLGAGQVIKGWDEGVVGMKIGGRRRLVIPSRLGDGERGAGGVIAPNETLIFVVDLLELR
jgi:peptidylprolyl isomerase